MLTYTSKEASHTDAMRNYCIMAPLQRCNFAHNTITSPPPLHGAIRRGAYIITATRREQIRGGCPL